MDRRVKYTKKVIKETFLNLLETKDISQITVKEICENADVNRATFYRYYLDIYDLLEKIEEDLIEDLLNSSPLEDLSSHSVYTFSKGILSILYDNKKLVTILFNTNRSLYFLNDILEICYSKLYNKWTSIHPEEDDEEIEYAAIYVFNGALGIINYWVKEGFEKDMDYIAHSIEKLSIYGAKKFFTTN